jgi:dihydroneopterin aldolase/2-amino-4-hydroxy-6-hydroxymethyldihydropteridine diphosphokinase
MGDKAENLIRAMELLEKRNLWCNRWSFFYQTAPWGILKQDDFVNAVADVAFEGEAPELLEAVLAVETEMGRIRQLKWGPRLIDIDILEFRREVWEKPDLCIPHPWYIMRSFVIFPLADIAPNYIPTGESRTILEIRNSFTEIPVRIKAFPPEKGP